MKIEAAPDGFRITFPRGGTVTLRIPEINTIDIETMPTMSVDVDYVTLGHENGDFMEISDDAEGFQNFCADLSRALAIDPPIHFRFPVESETGILRVYERT
jgi:hypothetical protein